MSWIFQSTPKLVEPSEALKGGSHPVLENPRPHAVLNTPITGPWKPGQKSVLIGIGCFWGPEKMYWETDGVESTSVGYAGGVTQNPTYREVCTGRTNHAEVVQVVYDPEKISLAQIIATALEAHNPTAGMRQGNDVGTQYRSAFYTEGDSAEEDRQLIEEMVAAYGEKLKGHGFGEVTTEIKLLSETNAGKYFLAEDEHQQYLHKNPLGYCPSHATGVACGI